jgi:hypothetical protein
MSSYEQPDVRSKHQLGAGIEYTVESANRLAEELRAIPPKDPAKRKLDKQGMVRLLAGEIVALQQRGYTIEEVAEGLRGRGLAITTPTLKNYLQRAKSKTDSRSKTSSRTASAAKDTGLPKTPTKRETANAVPPATSQAQAAPAMKQAPTTPEAGPAPEPARLRTGKGAFLIKDKDSY